MHLVKEEWMDVKVKVVCPDRGHTDRFGKYSEDSQF